MKSTYNPHWWFAGKQYAYTAITILKYIHGHEFQLKLINECLHPTYIKHVYLMPSGYEQDAHC